MLKNQPRAHTPNQANWKVVSATYDSVTSATGCLCGDEACAWTVTVYGDHFVHHAADGTFGDMETGRTGP